MISQASCYRFTLSRFELRRRVSRCIGLSIVWIVVFSSGLVESGGARAADEYLKEDIDDSIPFDVETERFQESEFEIPELSDESNWSELQFPAVSNSIRFYIDKATLSLADDKVLRYFMVLRNRSGKSTVYYEGLHCRGVRVKRYAYASAGKALKKLDKPRWQSIPTNTRNYHFVLFKGIFCDTGFGAKNVIQIREILTGQRATDASIYE